MSNQMGSAPQGYVSGNHGRIAGVAGPWYHMWAGKVIVVQRVTEPGGDNLKGDDGRPGRLRLKPRFVDERDGSTTLVNFKVKCTRSDADPALDGVLLSPLGSVAPALGRPLPAWKADGSLENIYSTALQPFVDQLDLPECTLQRLEGHYAVPVQGGINVDRMRIIAFAGGVEGNVDLALIRFTLLQGPSANQNGGGSGPPH